MSPFVPSNDKHERDARAISEMTPFVPLNDNHGQDSRAISESSFVASPDTRQRCNYCGQPAQIVWVHGHGQCSNCGINVDECCRGETGG